MPHFILTSRGSWGDINPFLILGSELARRGHEVTMLLSDHFAAACKTRGLAFVSHGDEASYQDEQAANRDIRRGPWHQERLIRWHVPELRRSFAFVEQAMRRDPTTIVVSRSWCFVGPLAHEALGTRFATVYITPVEVPGLLLRVPEDRWLERGILRAFEKSPLGRRVARDVYRHAISHMIDAFSNPAYEPVINDIRRELGLSKTRGFQTRAIESPLLDLGLWPRWFHEERRHWPRQHRTTGFLLDPPDAGAVLDPELEAMLGCATRPLVFMPGTYRSAGCEGFFEESIEVCRRLERPGIFLSEHRQQVPESLPAGIITRSYIPLELLLPRCGAVIHHGGIGTLAQGLRAGTPQLAVPVFSDQPLNGELLRKHGVGDMIPDFSYRAPRAERVLRRLLDEPSIAAACERARRCIRPTEDLEASARALEGLLDAPLRVGPRRS